MASIISLVLGFFSGLWSVMTKILEQMKFTEAVNQGKELQKAELAKEEIETNRKQTEILTENRTTEDTIKRLEDGTF